MKRFARLVAVLVVVGTCGLVSAQETKFDVNVGAQYPLLSQKFYVEQNLGFHARFGVRFGTRLTVSAVWEEQSTQSDIPNEMKGDVKIKLYGLNALWIFGGEPSLQLFGVLGAGLGKVTFDNPVGTVPEGVNDTDLTWYEGGVGAQFAWSRHWAGRLRVTGRMTDPKDTAAILQGSRFSIVPAIDFVYRF